MKKHKHLVIPVLAVLLLLPYGLGIVKHSQRGGIAARVEQHDMTRVVPQTGKGVVP